MNIKLWVKSISFEVFFTLSMITAFIMLCDLNHSVAVYMDKYIIPVGFNFISELVTNEPLNPSLSMPLIYSYEYFYHMNGKPFIPYFWVSALLFVYNLYTILLMFIVLCFVLPLIYVYKYFTLVSIVGIITFITFMSIKRYKYESYLDKVKVE